MSNGSEILTDISADWSPGNLAALRQILLNAYDFAAARTDRYAEPVFDTPNLSFVRGYMRWSVVDKMLHQACENGSIQGIRPEWRPLSSQNGIHALELVGDTTTLIACHVQDPNETPRDSMLRYSKRLDNQMTLPGLDEAGSLENGEAIHLVLVHGALEADFAFLRVYHDSAKPSRYRSVSNNLMVAPHLVDSFDSEPVVEPSVAVRNPAAFPGINLRAG